jgi:hypothetical protein
MAAVLGRVDGAAGQQHRNAQNREGRQDAANVDPFMRINTIRDPVG